MGQTKLKVGDIVEVVGLGEQNQGIGIITYIDGTNPEDTYWYLRWVVPPQIPWFYNHEHGDVHYSDSDMLNKIGECHATT
jgi:hypothetical protein